MKTNKIKTFTCTVNDSWMHSLERANISVKSPSGCTLILDKIKIWNHKPFGEKDTTDYSILHEIRDLVTKAEVKSKKMRIYWDIELTKDQMLRFKELVEMFT